MIQNRYRHSSHWIVAVIVSMWVAMGAARGQRLIWTHYTTGNSALPANDVRAVAVDAAGGMWFGTTQGVALLIDSRWYSFTTADSITGEQINDLLYEPDAEMWLATDNGITLMNLLPPDAPVVQASYRSDNTTLLSNRINTMALGLDGSRWFGTDSSITVLAGDHWITPANLRAVLKYDVVSISASPDSLVYCATEGGGVARLMRDGLDVITGASTIEMPWAPLPTDTIDVVLVDRSGGQWFGTRYGLLYHEGINSKSNWQFFTPANSLIPGRVQCLAEDVNGAIWVGTDAGVVIVYRRYTIDMKVITSADGLLNDDVRDIAQDVGGIMWLATAGGVSQLVLDISAVELHESPDRFDMVELQAYPSPFNSSTTVAFTVRMVTHARLVLYDVLGRQVRQLLDETVTPGRHSVLWPGDDSSGRPLASGVYMLQLQTERTVSSRKIIILK